MRDLMNFVDINEPAAGSILAGMREMAQVDGQEHTRELEMISMLESDLSGSHTDGVQLDSLNTRELQDIFLMSLALVALSDGALKPEESDLIHRYGADMGRSAGEVAAVLHDTAARMLSNFASVTLFRDQVMEIGRDLGLDDESIQRVFENSQSEDHIH